MKFGYGDDSDTPEALFWMLALQSAFPVVLIGSREREANEAWEIAELQRMYGDGPEL